MGILRLYKSTRQSCRRHRCPVLVGTVSRITGEPRLSLLSLLILFAGGAALLWRVDVKEGERMARGL